MHPIEEKIGYEFRNKALLEEALRHSSYLNETQNDGAYSNERLEFLGDSVLGLTAAEHLFCSHPGLPEGKLTRMRAALVCEGSLALAAAELQLGSFMSFGKGELKVGGSRKPSILADAMEALFGAVYLDGGWERARALVHTLVLAREQERLNAFYDYKTALQEYVQQDRASVLSYELVGEEGPEHEKLFRSRVLLCGKELGQGTGRNKKESQQEAARAGLQFLGILEQY